VHRSAIVIEGLKALLIDVFGRPFRRFYQHVHHGYTLLKLLFYLSDVPTIIASADKMTLSHRDVTTIFDSIDGTKVVE